MKIDYGQMLRLGKKAVGHIKRFGAKFLWGYGSHMLGAKVTSMDDLGKHAKSAVADTLLDNQTQLQGKLDSAHQSATSALRPGAGTYANRDSSGRLMQNHVRSGDYVQGEHLVRDHLGREGTFTPSLHRQLKNNRK
jgi:hypothetical protein